MCFVAHLCAGRCRRAVFPLVVHHGSKPWRAARDMQGLFGDAAPEALAGYRPNMRYFVLDEHRAVLPDSDDNLVAHLIALEKSPSPQATRGSIMQLHRYLSAPRHDTLRRAFTVYIQRVLLHRLVPGETIPEVNDLQEMDAMLADRVLEWTEKWKQDGMQAGHEQGLREGKEKGLQEGRLEGQRTLLCTLLETRFGDVLPTWAHARVEIADEAMIRAWTRAALTAPTLGAVFEDMA